MPEKKPDISMFTPAYNEENTVKGTVEAARNMLSRVANKYEIIIVDDGSVDNTGKIADELAKKYPEVRVVHHRPNKGYGMALRSGIAASKYEYIFYTDADLQFDLNDIGKLIPLLKKADIVSAYRVRRIDPVLRKFAAWVYNIIIWLYWGYYIKDIDCAFKIYHRKIFDTFNLSCTHGIIDPEILIKAKVNGFKIAQVGVKHLPRKKGKTVFAGRLGLIKFSHLMRLLREMRMIKAELKQMKKLNKTRGLSATK
jgi:glycosyltransferase involved in cell wall biosynthesis